MDRERVLAFRAARQGLAGDGSLSHAQAAACPASDFQRSSALLALAARSRELTLEGYERAVDEGELVVGHSLRAAIHALAPGDAAVFGRALLAEDAAELLRQLGEQAKRLLTAEGIDPRDALAEVADAASDALGERGALDRSELHEELRRRVRPELLPRCKGCKSHHVAPMLWRYALVRLGARRDSARRYVLGEPGEAAEPVEAARRFLRFYGPGTMQAFGAWAGLAGSHARRLWEQLAPEVVEVEVGGRRGSLLAEDEPDLEDLPDVRGLRLLPPGDPFLQHPNRAALVPDADLRRRLFRPVGSPGAVLADGELRGLWRARVRGKRLEVEVDELAPLDEDRLAAEAERVAALRGLERSALRVER